MKTLLPLTLLLTTSSPSLLPPTTSPSPLHASRPECFPPSPACLRPYPPECRDALLKMRFTDPGYPTTFGRHLEWHRHTIDVPRTWHSYPKNCVVKLDAVVEDATDTFRLRSLMLQGQEVVTACVVQGTRCGGVINVGPRKVMLLSVGHYSAFGVGVGLGGGGNESVVGEKGGSGFGW